jgi:hypothetical protein
LEQELAVVAARAGKQRRRAERLMPGQRGLVVHAGTVTPAGQRGGAAEQSVHRAGVAGERPLDAAVRERLELRVEPGAAVAVAEMGGGLGQRAHRAQPVQRPR